MRTRRLGNSDLELSTIGLGTWAIGGGGWSFAWGPQAEEASIATIHDALDRGINWIDTAPIYGMGTAELVVGKAIAGLPQRPIIATKCGRVWDDDRNITARIKADSVKRECEDSLRRLGVDVIDLYQIHWPEPDEDIEEAWDAISALESEGKIRWAGVSNFSAAQMTRLHSRAPIASLQPPYSLLRRDVESGPLPWCGEHGVGVVAYSPMQKGLLTGKMTAARVAALPEDDHRRRDPMFKVDALARANKVASTLSEVAVAHHTTAAAIAVAWVLRHPAMTSAIVGARRADQMADIVAAGDLDLTAGEAAAIEAAV